MDRRNGTGDDTDPTLATIAAWPAVEPWVGRVREATTALRWHSAPARPIRSRRPSGLPRE